MTSYDKFNIYLAVAACMTGLFVLVFSACTTPRLEKAFTPKMDSSESQQVISEYCITCHVHKDFEPAAHVKIVPTLYKNPKYKNTTECRACHTYTKTWLLDVRRHTHWPEKND